jgi:hypothetical protein
VDLKLVLRQFNEGIIKKDAKFFVESMNSITYHERKKKYCK